MSATSSPAPLRVVHVITGLHTGGAEMMLYKILSRQDRKAFAPFVVSLTQDGAVGAKIRDLGVPVFVLGMRRGGIDPAGLVRLAGHLRSVRPHLVQTWLYHGDLIGGLAAKMAGVRRVAWNVRNSDYNAPDTKRGTLLAANLCARLSRAIPDRILCCSQVAAEQHARAGYAREKFAVVPNGFDISHLRPDVGARADVRRELGVDDGALLVGLVARFAPPKDHRGFVQAAGRVRQAVPHAQFVLVGTDVDKGNAALAEWIAETGCAEVFHLLGRRDDVARLNASLDVAVSASAFGEGFPNVIGEAMACGVPCVVTDSGDAGFVVGETGRVVAPRDPDALAEAMVALLTMGDAARAEQSARARRRVVEHFEIGAITRRYEALHREIIGVCAD